MKGQAVLSAGFMGIYLHKFAAGKWTPTELIKGDPDPWPKSGASDMALGHLGQQRFIATIEPWHGNQIVVYRENGTELAAADDRRHHHRRPRDHPRGLWTAMAATRSSSASAAARAA